MINECIFQNTVGYFDMDIFFPGLPRRINTTVSGIANAQSSSHIRSVALMLHISFTLSPSKDSRPPGTLSDSTEANCFSAALCLHAINMSHDQMDQIPLSALLFHTQEQWKLFSNLP